MKSTTPQKTHGFSLIELILVVAVILILAAVTVPHMVNIVSDISLRYVAQDFGGLVQSARIQAVRKNTFYTIRQGTLPAGTPVYYIDIPKAGVYTNGDPVLPLSASVTIHPGTGSGAPNETAFIAGIPNFTVNPGIDPPSFNARGLPCIAALNSCPQTPGQGFVVFMSKATVTGNVPWAAVVINASGHVQFWTSDVGGNWIQRD